MMRYELTRHRRSACTCGAGSASIHTVRRCLWMDSVAVSQHTGDCMLVEYRIMHDVAAS